MDSKSITQAKLFIGIDMHKRSWKVHCSSDLFAGKTFSMPPNPFNLFHYAQKKFPITGSARPAKLDAADYRLLRSVPGIGPLVACAILAELGDLRRFSSVKHLAAYVGLIPGIHQSGEKQRFRNTLSGRHHSF